MTDPTQLGPDADRIAELEREIAEAEAANEAATGWGAAVGARWECIKGLRAKLARLRDEPSLRYDNPAPDASAPSVPTGSVRNATLTAAISPGPQDMLAQVLIERIAKIIEDGDEAAIPSNETAKTILAALAQSSPTQDVRDALKPFAKAADHLEKCRDDRPLWAALETGWAQREAIPLTVGDLRRARAALARSDAQPDAERHIESYRNLARRLEAENERLKHELRQVSPFAESAQSDAQLVAWTCFHCGEHFDNIKCAQTHFGMDESRTPGCVEKLEGGDLGLLRRVRELEEQLIPYLSETSTVENYVHGLKADHSRALIQAEQEGYDKGLRDGKEVTAPPRPDASGLVEAADHLIASADQMKDQADKLRAIGTDECNEQAGELEIIEPCLRAEANYLRSRAADRRAPRI